MNVPVGAGRLTIDVWDRFGELVCQLVDETDPHAGARQLEWDVVDERGTPVGPGDFLIRVTVDDGSESQIVQVTDQAHGTGATSGLQ